jgi:ATP-dependent exoDNAse (exonuclease V) alpha subunit
VEKYNHWALDRFEEWEITAFKAIHKELPPNTELPCPKVLRLAEGMRIMTIVNDRQYKNGSLGTILKVSRNSIRVLFDNCTVATVRRKKFTLPEGSVYEQLPVVLAYAFTVHKCQGCTFDSIVIVPGFFAAGQLYTALSRCRSIDGICIDGHITKEDLIIDTEALRMTL